MNIEKDVPIPVRSSKYARNGTTGVMRSMAIGDSIFVPETLVSNLYTYAIRAGIKITTRAEVSEAHPRGRRIWRVG